MYNVLIVDDEYIITQGLSVLIDWAEYGFNVIDTAQSGKEALMKIENNKFDLIITDIRMPGLDGLELINEIKNKNNTIKFIVLSGYREFNYAQRGIQLGVEDYLLKPVNREELIQRLQKIKTKLDNELYDAYLKSMDSIRDKFVLDFVNGYIQEDLIDAGLYKNHLEFREEYFRIAIIKIDNFYEVLEKGVKEAGILKHSVKMIIEDSFKSRKYGLVYEDCNDCIGIVLNFKKNLQNYELQEVLENLADKLMKNTGAISRIGIGDVVNSRTEIKTSNKQAQYIVNKLSKEMVLENVYFYNKINFKENKIWKVDWDSNKLLKAIEEFNIQEITATINELFEKIYEINVKSSDIKAYIWSIILSLHILIKRSGGESNTELDNELLEKSENSFGDNKELKDNLIRYCVVTGQNMTKKVETRMVHIIQQIKNYVNEKYFEDLSLKSISSIIFMNSAYLGQVFKTVTNETFSDYLNKVRIREAKIKFLNSNEKMATIIESVGYKNTEYFYRQFKKYEGISFVEFRTKLMIK